MKAALEPGTVHDPSALMPIYGRCPVPELRALGVNVALGSDAAAPDRGYDWSGTRMPALSPPFPGHPGPRTLGRARDVHHQPARALRFDRNLGSLEVGRKAEIVLVDRRSPHLVPEIMPVTALAHFASAGDVDTVIVDGQVLTRGGRRRSTSRESSTT